MLNKRNRLTKRGSFTYVYKKGARQSQGYIRLVYVTCKGAPKVGISVPNTVGKAVVRNKVRRRIRAAVRQKIGGCKGAQMVFSACKGAETLSYADIERAVERLLTRSGLYEKKESNAVARD